MYILLILDGKKIKMPIDKEAIDISNIWNSICNLPDDKLVTMEDILGALDKKYHDHPCLNRLPNKKEFTPDDMDMFLCDEEFSLSNIVVSYIEFAFQKHTNQTVVNGYLHGDFYNLKESDIKNNIYLKYVVDTEISEFDLVNGEDIIWDNDISKSYWKKYKKHLDLEKSNGAKLYWVETCDHDEDWFIVAQNSEIAKQFHNDYEGYDYIGTDIWCETGSIRAIPVCKVPPNIFEKHANTIEKFSKNDGGEFRNIFDINYAFHAQLDMLDELGFETISDVPRVVKMDGIEFREGGLQTQVDHVRNMHFNKDLN